jgi:acyl carrier protein
MSDVYDRLIKLLITDIGLEGHEIHPTDTFTSLEVDSLALVELSLAAQQEFSVVIADDDFSRDSTIAQAAAVIEAKTVSPDGA